MSGASGTLHQPRHALGRADLQNALDRQEVHAQIQAGGTDHGLERALLEALLDPVAYFAGQRTMVQGNQACPVRPRIEQRLIPDFRLRAGVGEHQGGRGRINLLDHLRQHAQTEMPSPGEALDARRQQGVDAQILVDLALHQPAAAGIQQHVQRVGLVAEGGGKAPDDQLRHPLAQPG